MFFCLFNDLIKLSLSRFTFYFFKFFFPYHLSYLKDIMFWNILTSEETTRCFGQRVNMGSFLLEDLTNYVNSFENIFTWH